MSTIKQVSERAGVSQATVSRVMNGTARVSERTRERVEAAMAALGYQPNAFAQALASNRSNAIGLVVTELNGPFYGQMMEALETVLRQAGKPLLIASSHSDAAMEQAAVDFLLSRRCDGLVLHTERLADTTLMALNEQVPIVSINRLITQAPALSVLLDNTLGGYLATRHLLDRGHRRIACIGGPEWKQDAAGRVSGYHRALREAGVEPEPALLVSSQFTEGSGREAAQRLLATGQAFTALFAGDDDIAIGAMQVFSEAGLRVPDDVSVVGFDDAPYARYLTPALTTVYLPIREMARAAGQTLLHRLYGIGEPGLQRLRPELVVRASTARRPI